MKDNIKEMSDDDLKTVINNGQLVGDRDPLKLAIEQGREFNDTSAIKWAIDNNKILYDGMPAYVYALKQGISIDGKNPVEYLISSEGSYEDLLKKIIESCKSNSEMIDKYQGEFINRVGDTADIDGTPEKKETDRLQVLMDTYDSLNSKCEKILPEKNQTTHFADATNVQLLNMIAKPIYELNKSGKSDNRIKEALDILAVKKIDLLVQHTVEQLFPKLDKNYKSEYSFDSAEHVVESYVTNLSEIMHESGCLSKDVKFDIDAKEVVNKIRNSTKSTMKESLLDLTASLLDKFGLNKLAQRIRPNIQENKQQRLDKALSALDLAGLTDFSKLHIKIQDDSQKTLPTQTPPVVDHTKTSLAK